jgi:hypothetical protein
MRAYEYYDVFQNCPIKEEYKPKFRYLF